MTEAGLDSYECLRTGSVISDLKCAVECHQSFKEAFRQSAFSHRQAPTVLITFSGTESKR